MPCYDGGPDYGSSEISILNDKNNKLEASLCALISELVKRGLADEILPEASRKGKIDLMAFWEKHNAEDRTRLAVALHKFSVHEQEILREILNDTSRK